MRQALAEPSRPSLRERNRQVARDVVLDAAERLLQQGDIADFSMRALAAEAGVGFATPFNHFGSKNAIMQALSSRLIERMAARFRDEAPDGDMVDRILVMGRISITLLLEKAAVHKVVVGSLGIAGPMPASVRQNSRELWSLALGDMAGVADDLKDLAEAVLADQLAFSFRGCVSFWIAGELQDEQLSRAVHAGICISLLGFIGAKRRTDLIGQLR